MLEQLSPGTKSGSASAVPPTTTLSESGLERREAVLGGDNAATCCAAPSIDAYSRRKRTARDCASTALAYFAFPRSPGGVNLVPQLRYKASAAERRLLSFTPTTTTLSRRATRDLNDTD